MTTVSSPPLRAQSAMDDPEFAPALGTLREALVELKRSELWGQIVEPRDAVYARFQPIFQQDHIPKLTEDEIRPFFYIENNRHWSGLYRQVNRVCSDMPQLRKVLLTLTDEARAIEDRLDEIDGAILGMGKAIITAILTVTFPAKYGVWNNTSEGSMLKLGIFPEFERGASFGRRYGQISDILRRFADSLDIDFWTLDALWWWHLTQGRELPALPEKSVGGQQFGLERHLHDFLYDNWAQTELGRVWDIYAEPGDPEAGYEYACDVGRIDILARHKAEKKWLVVELKRNETSDAVVGQVLRYMGWVRQHLAKTGEGVEGVVIARSVDPSLQYAVSVVPAVRIMTYAVEFRLDDAQPLPTANSR